MKDQIYSNILTGYASEKEKKDFYEELGRDEKKQEEFIRLKRLWDLSQMAQNTLSSQRKKQLFREFLHAGPPPKKNRLQRLYGSWKYAAAVVLVFLGGFWLNTLLHDTEPQKGWKQFHSGTGSISSILLEDGSKIWLNSNTTLSLNEKETLARLVGEAYFEINHNEKRTFTVDLGALKVRDMGTSFNISAYPDEENIRATLIDGQIIILDRHDRELSQPAVDETFRFKKTDGSFFTERLEKKLVTGWMENKFVFIDMPLAAICQEIEKWYGVSVLIGDEQLKTEKYTSVVRRTTTVAQLMEMLKLTTGINYKITEQEGRKPAICISK